jgi:hypothetical protein
MFFFFTRQKSVYSLLRYINCTGVTEFELCSGSNGKDILGDNSAGLSQVKSPVGLWGSGTVSGKTASSNSNIGGAKLVSVLSCLPKTEAAVVGTRTAESTSSLTKTIFDVALLSREQISKQESSLMGMSIYFVD